MNSSKPFSFPDLKDRVALVTGGGGGIGQSVAEALVGQGMRIGLLDMDRKRLRSVRQKLRAYGEVVVFESDVTNETAVEGVVNELERELGYVDCVVHCAGIRGASVDIVDMPSYEWWHVLGVALGGAFVVGKSVGRRMGERGRGSIVLMGSTAGIQPRLGQGAYCVAKAGVAQLTRVLALELASTGVRVNAVCPGATKTEFLDFAAQTAATTREDLEEQIIDGHPETFRSGIPLRRLADPVDHSATIALLLSDASRHVTGQIVYIDGGESLL